METISASVVKEGENAVIRIMSGSTPIDISITSDDPNAVKRAFNALLLRLRKHGEFKIDLGTVGSDLHSQVAKEYIGHLNKELAAVYAEMGRMGFKA